MTDRSEVINDATAETPAPASGGGASGRGATPAGGRPARIPGQRTSSGGSQASKGSIPVPPRAAGSKLVPAPPRVEIPPEHLEAIRSGTGVRPLPLPPPPARSTGGGGRGPGGGKRGKARKGAQAPLATAETEQLPAVAVPLQPTDTGEPAAPADADPQDGPRSGLFPGPPALGREVSAGAERSGEAGFPPAVDGRSGERSQREKGRHAAETGIFPAITAEALAAEALAAAAAFDGPPIGAPDPFTDPAAALPAAPVEPAGPVEAAEAPHDYWATTVDAPTAGQANTAELAPVPEVSGDDSPTVADSVPALAIMAVDEGADIDDDHYRGARRKRLGGRYPLGALLVIGVIVVIMVVVAVQLFNGGSHTPTAVADGTTGAAATPNLAVPPADSPSVQDTPSASPSATHSHAPTKAAVPPASHPASPTASTAPPVVSHTGSLGLATAAGRCATVSRGGGLVLAGCNGSGSQKFTMPGDGTVRMQQMGNICLDLSHGSTDPRTPVQLAPCSGSGTQKWAFASNNTLKNSQAGRCLDAENGNTGDNTRLIIWDCSGSANQQWKLN